MSIQVQSKNEKPGTLIDFEFSDDITQYVVGVSEFSFTFGGDDHHVQKAEMNLAVNKASSRRLQVTAGAILSDSSGNVLDVNDSSITVVAVAWVGANASSLVMANRDGISDGGNSGAISLPGPNPTIFQSMLSGFDLEYSKDHHVRSLHAGVGVQQDMTEGFITANAGMSDDSGNTASVAKVNGGMIASTSSSSGFQVYSICNLQDSSTVIEVDPTYQKVQALLVSYTGQFSKDHHVKTFGASISAGDLSNHQSSVTGKMTMTDDSGHNQDNSNSHVTGILVAYDPKS